MISIIIPTFNTAVLIERSIRSVLNQKNISDFELIIVDDCSTDDTLDVVHSINDPRIRIFRQRENRGPAAARNRGLSEAKGE
ncbi:MAG: glycosyltransferase family 2 protein [Treponema sp.]|nr:glycosyltransferase family 2 protein [Treponema sp.]